jgi:hypothetical protein
MLPEEGGVCTNMDGTHVCACADGWTGDGYSTARYTAAHAEEGFVAPGGVDPSTYTGCADVDECTVYTDICGAGIECTNTIGSYTCGNDPGTGETDPGTGGTDPGTGEHIPTNNCAGLGSICDHASCDDEVVPQCSRTSCTMSCSNGEAINISQVSCVDTGKLKKQGWRNGKKKIPFNTPINCGNLNREFCGIQDLNAHFGVGNNYIFDCEATKGKCKPSCAGGGRMSPKKLKCKNGKLNTNRVSGC